jgi:hypothetical protein
MRIVRNAYEMRAVKVSSFNAMLNGPSAGLVRRAQHRGTAGGAGFGLGAYRDPRISESAATGAKLSINLGGEAMKMILRIGALCIISFASLLAVPTAGAQQAPYLPPAPVPVQVLTGKKVFVSNGDSDVILKIPNLSYNEFYALLKSSGMFELVPTPAEADLIFEIRIAYPTDPHLHLVILDPKTHVVLWALSQQVQPWARESTGRKNFDKGMNVLVDDLKQLTSARQPAADAGNK